jgi:hypothetical protein
MISSFLFENRSQDDEGFHREHNTANKEGTMMPFDYSFHIYLIFDLTLAHPLTINQ